MHTTNINGNILFDVNDPDTMTQPADVSTKWNNATVVLATSSRYGVITVYDNSYNATKVLAESKTSTEKMISNINGSWDIHTHCDWCGQKLDYVAVIVGIEDGTNKATINHIGCDCVGKIFGIRWFGYRNTVEVKKKLIADAKKHKRSAEYPKKYAKELAWLDSLPAFLLNKNTFLVDMKKIMRSGEREVSKNMESYLHALQERKEYDPKTFATAKQEIDKTLEKLRGIMHLIEEVDASSIARNSQWSAYNFVKSIMEKFERYHSPLTKKQMDALNRVYVKYRDSRIKKNTNQMKGDPNVIPW